jgi:hypothetical protein
MLTLRVTGVLAPVGIWSLRKESWQALQMPFTIAEAMLSCHLITQNETNRTNRGISSAKFIVAFKVCMHCYISFLIKCDSDRLLNGQIDNYRGTCVRVLST